jgi:hypothetical protein
MYHSMNLLGDGSVVLFYLLRTGLENNLGGTYMGDIPKNCPQTGDIFFEKLPNG